MRLPGLQTQVLSGILAILGKMLSQVLKNLLHRFKNSFRFIWDPGPIPGHTLCPELQAQVLSSTLAVLGKMLGQILKNLLHDFMTPFGSIRTQSPAPGHLM